MMAPLDRLRLQRGVAHLCALGPRAVTELLAEVADSAGCAPCILDHLARYQRLTPAMVRAAGGERIPPRALRSAERVA